MIYLLIYYNIYIYYIIHTPNIFIAKTACFRQPVGWSKTPSAILTSRGRPGSVRTTASHTACTIPAQERVNAVHPYNGINVNNAICNSNTGGRLPPLQPAGS